MFVTEVTQFCVSKGSFQDGSLVKLNIDFGLGAAKISEVKVGGKKKYLPSGRVRTHAHAVGRVGRYFFGPPTLTSDIFAAS